MAVEIPILILHFIQGAKVVLSALLIVLGLNAALGFLKTKDGFDTHYTYKVEANGTKFQMTLRQIITVDVFVRANGLKANSYIVRLNNATVFDQIDFPTKTEKEELVSPFVLNLYENGSIANFETIEKEFPYVLKNKYRVAQALVTNSSQFREFINGPDEAVADVNYLPFGKCRSDLKVIRKPDKVTVLLKAKREDCDPEASESKNLAKMFEMAENSTCGIVASYDPETLESQGLGVRAQMTLYSLGGIELTLKAVLEFNDYVAIELPVNFWTFEVSD